MNSGLGNAANFRSDKCAKNVDISPAIGGNLPIKMLLYSLHEDHWSWHHYRMGKQPLCYKQGASVWDDSITSLSLWGSLFLLFFLLLVNNMESWLTALTLALNTGSNLAALWLIVPFFLCISLFTYISLFFPWRDNESIKARHIVSKQ